mmetsp:Transcript_33343/g.43916  ORF Transcript_33343/g.43916 Transcript_33343/m.43916 type:complete len:228 (-) Transcript_33343:31-714(-)
MDWPSTMACSPSLPHFSTYFLLLSHAPPALAIVSASMKPAVREPPRRPARPRVPMRKPMAGGVKTARVPGRSISWMAAREAMETQRAASGKVVFLPSPRSTSWRRAPRRRDGAAENWKRTSVMMARADLSTESIVRAAKTKGSMAPMRRPASTTGSLRSMGVLARPDCSMYATRRPTEVRTAEPMAKPLPVAAVVLPRESRRSVRSRMEESSSAISAMPPALSATGP